MTTPKKAVAKAPAKKATAKREPSKTERLAPESMELLEVTPAMAKEWMEDPDFNEVNRNLRPKLVNAYRRDMEAGRWEFTGEPIQLSRTGRLLNGQHRLSALAGATKLPGGSLKMVVIRGLNDHAQAMMDQGKARNVRDALLLEHGHIKNLTLVAAVSRWLVLCDFPGPHMTPNLMRGKVTTAEALAAYNRFPEIEVAAQRATYLRKHIYGSPSAVAYTWLALHRVDPEANTEFWGGMIDMEWAWKSDPRKAALRRMQTVHVDQEIKTSIETGIMMVSVMTRAWNAWRNKEEMDTIMVKSRGGIILPVKPV